MGYFIRRSDKTRFLCLSPIECIYPWCWVSSKEEATLFEEQFDFHRWSRIFQNTDYSLIQDFISDEEESGSIQ